MSFLQTIDPSKHKKLTERQEKFLDVLGGEAKGDLRKSIILAGYEETSYYAVIKSLRQQIVDVANTILAHSAPKAAQSLVTVLDRVGVSKKEHLNVSHNVTGGIFLLPDKKETIINGEVIEND